MREEEAGEGEGREKKPLLTIREAVTVNFFPRQRGFRRQIPGEFTGETAAVLSTRSGFKKPPQGSSRGLSCRTLTRCFLPRRP